MSQAHSRTESSIDTSGAAEENTRTQTPTIESGRYTRAVTEDMTVEQVADRFYEVHSQSGSTYEVDLQTGACTCPDCERRGDRYVCKHAIRAGLVETVANSVSTRTVAKVAGYARNPDHDCPTEGQAATAPARSRATVTSPARVVATPPDRHEPTSSTSGWPSSRPIERATAS